MKRLSIITANYNCKTYLKDCIESVRLQNFESYEHIILDDCSADSSMKVIKEMLHPNLRIIQSENRLHCGSAYHRLANEAEGEIVCVLDSDDVLCKGSMKKISSLYSSNPDIDFIWTQFWFCDPNLKKVKRGFCYCPKTSLLDVRHCFSHWRTFSRRMLEGEAIFPVGVKAAVDKYMGYVLEEKGQGGFADVPLYKYRQRLGGLSFTGRKIWKKMKEDFAIKRMANNIIPHKIRNIEV